MSPTFGSLRIRNYRLFASGQVVSLTGTWMQRVAQDWLVLQLTGSGVAVGITTGLQFLPLLLFGLYGGILADRYPKRRTLLITQVAMGLVALTLGLLTVTGAVTVQHVYLLALLLGVITAVDTPVRQAFVTELVGREHVANAVGLNSATFNAARVLGPAVAGLIITVGGTGPVFLVNAASFAAVVAGLALMHDEELFVGERPVGRRPGQFREGLGYVARRPDLLWPIVLVGVIGTFGLNFQMTTALMVTDVFRRDAAAYGLLSSSLAFGSLIGALLAARREEPRQRWLIGAALAFGLLEVAAGLMPSYTAFMVWLVPTGVAILTFTTTANATVQLGADAAMRGRVMGLYVLVFLGGTPIGAPFMGWVAERFGPRWSLVGGGLVCALAALVVGVLLLRARGLVIRAHVRPRPHLHVVTAQDLHDAA
ncbi:MAG TPA: MFS transporter [Mycobacteriales bacterium]|nr:MFS transporter [Mycobacteriales bacterium]